MEDNKNIPKDSNVQYDYSIVNERIDSDGNINSYDVKVSNNIKNVSEYPPVYYMFNGDHDRDQAIEFAKNSIKGEVNSDGIEYPKEGINVTEVNKKENNESELFENTPTAEEGNSPINEVGTVDVDAKKKSDAYYDLEDALLGISENLTSTETNVTSKGPELEKTKEIIPINKEVSPINPESPVKESISNELNPLEGLDVRPQLDSNGNPIVYNNTEVNTSTPGLSTTNVSNTYNDTVSVINEETKIPKETRDNIALEVPALGTDTSSINEESIISNAIPSISEESIISNVNPSIEASSEFNPFSGFSLLNDNIFGESKISNTSNTSEYNNESSEESSLLNVENNNNTVKSVSNNFLNEHYSNLLESMSLSINTEPPTVDVENNAQSDMEKIRKSASLKSPNSAIEDMSKNVSQSIENITKETLTTNNSTEITKVPESNSPSRVETSNTVNNESVNTTSNSIIDISELSMRLKKIENLLSGPLEVKIVSD